MLSWAEGNQGETRHAWSEEVCSSSERCGPGDPNADMAGPIKLTCQGHWPWQVDY
jgi:hypothetical protein